MSHDDPLRAEHESIQRAVHASRRSFAVSAASAFVRAGRECMDEYLRMRSQDVARDDALRGLESVLRDIWPKKPTKFPPSCDACGGTSWREMACWDSQRCGRERCVKAGPAFEHRYVVVCECAAERRRPKVWSDDDAIAAAGRMRKAKSRGGWSRAGR